MAVADRRDKPGFGPHYSLLGLVSCIAYLPIGSSALTFILTLGILGLQIDLHNRVLSSIWLMKIFKLYDVNSY